ncbi:MAG: sugar phosphate isomerase [Elusimicrobia bacterium RIFOXYD2_FULL_34_15]|nr:MAG: sugar phosphate isomerase [Elusimicrobia bacterium RIFOXYD2_FULL_34_15]
MKLGFATVCLDLNLENIVNWSKKEGFEVLEVACWPAKNQRDFARSHIDVENFDEKKANEVINLFSENNIEISSLAYYDNMLDPNLKEREYKQNHLKKVIDAAKLVKCDLVGTFIGRDPNKTIKENFIECKKSFKPIVDYAEEKGIRIMIENCPMEGWQIEGLPGTISYSPELWDEMFSIIPNKNFGLNFDPSHLYWLQVDYWKATNRFSKYIFHVHAKDTEILKDKLDNVSIYGKGWWQYRIPGLGGINWLVFIKILQGAGYNGAISIEHEDPIWSGSEEKIKEGLKIGFKNLKNII